MDKRIKPDELDSVDVRKFSEVRAVAAGESSEAGHSLWFAMEMPRFSSGNAEGKPMESHVLFIEMPNPDDDQAREALRKEVISRISAPSPR